MDFQIKAFSALTLQELYDILAVRTDVFVVEQECPYPEVDGKDPQCYHIFAKEGDTIVAYLRVLPAGLSFDEPSIGRVLVKESHRSQGLARSMMETAISFIDEKWQAKAIRISAQTYLKDFYGSLGFEVAGEAYLEDGIPHVDMVYPYKRS